MVLADTDSAVAPLVLPAVENDAVDAALPEEGVEGDASSFDGLVASVVPVMLDTMLEV